MHMYEISTGINNESQLSMIDSVRVLIRSVVMTFYRRKGTLVILKNG